MLLVTLRDGSTRTWDLLHPGEVEEATRVLPSLEVTSLTLHGLGNRVDLPLPRRFHRVSYSVEVLRGDDGVPLAERLLAQADAVALTLTLHLAGRSGRLRVDLDRRGLPRWQPDRTEQPGSGVGGAPGNQEVTP